MNKLPEIKLVGIKVRTNNALEADPMTGKIMPTIQSYFHRSLFEKISDRKKPGTTYCVYTNYESDHTGDYTYFVGEEVTCFDSLCEELTTLTIPSQSYVKFTNGPGVMPDVCIDVWKKIWNMTPEDLGAKRSYVADFEIYDERSCNPLKTTLDIYIGIFTE
jgi:predicted transcriptional regulator YdeE